MVNTYNLWGIPVGTGTVENVARALGQTLGMWQTRGPSSGPAHGSPLCWAGGGQVLEAKGTVLSLCAGGNIMDKSMKNKYK